MKFILFALLAALSVPGCMPNQIVPPTRLEPQHSGAILFQTVVDGGHYQTVHPLRAKIKSESQHRLERGPFKWSHSVEATLIENAGSHDIYLVEWHVTNSDGSAFQASETIEFDGESSVQIASGDETRVSVVPRSSEDAG